MDIEIKLDALNINKIIMIIESYFSSITSFRLLFMRKST